MRPGRNARAHYGDVSDTRASEWRYTAFTTAHTTAKTDPQQAVTDAAHSFAEAVLDAAKTALETEEREIRAKSNKKSVRRKPAYWNPQLQALSRHANRINHDLVAAIQLLSAYPCKDVARFSNLEALHTNVSNSLWLWPCQIN